MDHRIHSQMFESGKQVVGGDIRTDMLAVQVSQARVAGSGSREGNDLMASGDSSLGQVVSEHPGDAGDEQSQSIPRFCDRPPKWVVWRFFPAVS